MPMSHDPYPAPNTQFGFTLLEILIAVFIFGLVASAIFTAYRGTLSVMDATESQEDVYQMARIAMERISGDLESAYYREQPPENSETAGTEGASPEPILFYGERKEIQDIRFSELRFLSLAHITFSDNQAFAEPAEISYYAASGAEEDQLDLYRSDTLSGHERPEAGTGGVLLCRGLSTIDFVYYDEDGESYETWDASDGASKGRLPARVSILLEFTNRADPEQPLRFMSGVAIPMGG